MSDEPINPQGTDMLAPWRVEREEDQLVKFRIHELGGRPTISIWCENDHPDEITRNNVYHEIALIADNKPETARLIAASGNAIRSAAHELGIPAVTLAERLENGGIAEMVRVLEAHKDSSDSGRSIHSASESDK